MVVKGIDKRGMVRDRQVVIVGISTRVTLLTSTTPTPSMSDTDPFSNRATEAPTQKIIHAFFTETRSQLDSTDSVGDVRQRKGYIEYHQIYANRVNAAEACIVHGEPGRWRFTGAVEITGGTTQKAYIVSQD